MNTQQGTTPAPLATDLPQATIDESGKPAIGYRIIVGLWYFLLALMWGWAALAILYSPIGKRWWGQLLAAAFFVGTATAAVWWRRRPLWLTAIVLPSIGVVALCFGLQSPESLAPTRDEWTAEHQRGVTAEFIEEEDTTFVSLDNVRSRYQDQVRFDSLVLDLNTLETVWLGVQQFSSRRGIAHTFTSFGFENGEYIAISVEARRRTGQTYSPMKGAFRHYPLIYVAGDEEEILGQRALDGEHPIHLYRVNATPQQAQDMFVAMVERANRLAEAPEFYNTFTNSCTTNIVQRFNEIAPVYISPYDLRILLPGYSGHVAYEQGLLGKDKTYEEIHRRARISDEARRAAGTGIFSQVVRQDRL